MEVLAKRLVAVTISYTEEKDLEVFRDMGYHIESIKEQYNYTSDDYKIYKYL